MDSFYEQPRSIKSPQSLEQLYPSPVVPEVSMIVQNGVPVGSSSSGDSMLLTYKAWKERNCKNVQTNVLQNVAYSSQSDIHKKQVRFESRMQSNSPNKCEPIKTKTFEQIYLASIPNRQLDVSVIDSPKKCRISNKENTENINPNISLSQTTKISCHQIVPNNLKSEVSKILPDRKVVQKNKTEDLCNYKWDNFDAYKVHEKVLSKQYIKDKCESRDSTDKSDEHFECNCKQNQNQFLPSCPIVDSKNIKVFDKESNEPTVKDLLKIIQQQNEQLLLLQKQVASILNTADMPKQIEAPQFEKYQTSTQIEKPSISLKRPMQQFSLDVMTSFEVSIRRQQNLNRPCKDNYYQPKITEITETSSKASQESTHNVENKPFSAPLVCRDTGRVDSGSSSLANIINIDMNDYSSDDSSDDEVEETTNLGWTFYNNIMGQVNEIFKKSGIRPFPVNDKLPSNEVSEDLFKHNVMKKVKEATVKHLRSIGVHVPAMDISDEAIGCSPDNSNPNNISFAVKQLLMKYLPDEQLAKVPLVQEQNIQLQKKRPPGLIQRRPEFSVATLQYMQKYNLLNDDNQNIHQAKQVHRPNQQSSNFERILDITAIRQQPKLL